MVWLRHCEDHTVLMEFQDPPGSAWKQIPYLSPFDKFPPPPDKGCLLGHCMCVLTFCRKCRQHWERKFSGETGWDSDCCSGYFSSRTSAPSFVPVPIMANWQDPLAMNKFGKLVPESLFLAQTSLQIRRCSQHGQQHRKNPHWIPPFVIFHSRQYLAENLQWKAFIWPRRQIFIVVCSNLQWICGEMLSFPFSFLSRKFVLICIASTIVASFAIWFIVVCESVKIVSQTPQQRQHSSSEAISTQGHDSPSWFLVVSTCT